jgi:hypothetical protein
MLPAFGEPIYFGVTRVAHGREFLRRMFKAAFKYSALLLPSQAAFVTICSSLLTGPHG